MNLQRSFALWIALLTGSVFLPASVSGMDQLREQEPARSGERVQQETTASYQSTELLPLTDRSGYFLLKKEGHVPEELPFTVRKNGENRYVLHKEGRVKHVLEQTEDGIFITGEIDLMNRRRVTYDPPVPLLPAQTPPSRSRINGSSTVDVSGFESDRITDSGTCRWTLTFVGTVQVQLPMTTRRVYRYELERRIHLGFLKNAVVRVTFDYRPGTGQVRAAVDQDTRSFGLVGSREEWTLERIDEHVPTYESGRIIQETNSLLLRRYTRSSQVLAHGKTGEADRYLHQIGTIVNRLDLSISELDTEKKRKVTHMYDELKRSAERTEQAGELTVKRHRFQSVSSSLRTLLEVTGHGEDDPVRIMRCTRNEQLYWIAPSGHSDCPYVRGEDGAGTTGFTVQMLLGSK